jgi:hypothetical protein
MVACRPSLAELMLCTFEEIQKRMLTLAVSARKSTALIR